MRKIRSNRNVELSMSMPSDLSVCNTSAMSAPFTKIASKRFHHEIRYCRKPNPMTFNAAVVELAGEESDADDPKEEEEEAEEDRDVVKLGDGGEQRADDPLKRRDAVDSA